MTQVYSTQTEIYHEMYQHVYDYGKEFHFMKLPGFVCEGIVEEGKTLSIVSHK